MGVIRYSSQSPTRKTEAILNLMWGIDYSKEALRSSKKRW